MTHALSWHAPKTIALVGLMGAGKSSIGRRLAQALGLPFVDADTEIEAAAGATIEEIFERDGEAVFRDGERRVIARLLDGPAQVLATGGGAFMDPTTRGLIRERAISDLAARRSRPAAGPGRAGATTGRCSRPAIRAPCSTRLIAERYPVYAEADITVDTVDGPPEATLAKVIDALDHYLARGESGSAP